MKRPLRIMFSFISICFSEQFYFEDFAANSFPPSGWETSGSPVDSNRWEIDNSTNTFNTTPPALAYHWSPSTPGNYEPYSHVMLSPNIDVFGNTSVLVFFDIALDFWGASNFTNGMTVSYNNGLDWIDILNYEIGPGAGFVEINRRTESFIAEIESGSSIQLRFTAYGTNSYYIDDWFIDNIEIVSAPKLSIVSIESSNENPSKGITGDVATLDISSNTELLTDPVVQINGVIATVTNGGNNRWTATYEIQSSDPDGPIEFSIDFTDVNGVDGITVRQTTDNTNVIVDNSDPPNFLVGGVSARGGNEFEDIWNETNLEINLEALVPQDSAVSSYNYYDGNSIIFDGDNDHITINNISEYNFTNQMTIEAWIKPLSPPENYAGFLNRATDSGPLESGFGFVFSSTGWRFYIKTDLPEPIDYTTMPVASAPVDQWTHLAAIYTGSKVVLFRNGTALDSSVVYGNIEWSSAPSEITLGSFTKDGTTKYFNGHLDEVRIWNTVRTRQEIKVYRRVELNGNETGLVGYWKIDEGTGNLVSDYSQYLNNGNINGATWKLEDSPLEFKTPIYDTGVIIGSTFQLLGRVGSNNFEEFGQRDTITLQDFENGIKNISALKNDLESINSFSQGEILQLRAYLYDAAGNYSFSDVSSTNTTIDIIANAPIQASISSNNQFSNLAKTGDEITLSMEFDENVTAPGVYIGGNISTSVEDLGGEQYEALYNTSGDESDGFLSVLVNSIDIYGNQNEYGGTTDGTKVRFDKVLPALNQISVSSSNIWNQSWAKVGDTIQYNVNASEDLLNISLLVQGNNTTITELSLIEYTFQYIFTNDNSDGQVNFEVIFSDSAGNSGDIVTGTTNSSYTIFDKVPPSDFTVQDVITVGENSIANAWNSTNSAININIPVSDDESLDSGRVQIIAKVANNDFENLDSYHFFQSSDLNNSKIVSVSESLVESISGFSENDTITISAIIYDVPGNMTIGSESNTKLVINQSIPIIINSNIESDFSDSSLAGVDNIITLIFETDTEIIIPSVTISGQEAIIVNLGDNEWQASYTMQSSDEDGIIPFVIDFMDVYGNPNSVINSTEDGTSVTFDNSKPSLSFVSIKSSNQDTTFAKVGDTITIIFEADEVLISQIASINSNNTEITSINEGLLTKYYARYVMENTDNEGEINFEIIVTDSIGIQSNPVTETTNNSLVTFDRTQPVISNLHIESDNNYNTSVGISGDEIYLTFTSSEILLLDSVVAIISGADVPVNLNDGVYQGVYQLTGLEPSGNIIYTIDYQDLASNPGVQLDSTQDGSFVEHDLTPPEIINSYISSNNPDSSWAKSGDSVFVTFVSSEPLNNINLTIASIVSDYVQVNPTKYVGYQLMTLDIEQGVLPFSLTYTDQGGISGDPISSTSDNSKVNYDREEPQILNVSMRTNNIYGDTLAGIGTVDTLTFSISESYSRLTVELDGETKVPMENDLNFFTTVLFEEVDTSYLVPFSIIMKDSAGNQSEIITNEVLESQIWFDGQRPSIDSVLFQSNNSYDSTMCIVGDSVYLKFSSSEILQNNSINIANSSPDRFYLDNGFNYAVFEITENVNEGIIPFSIYDFRDMVGNLGQEVNQSNSSQMVILDNTPPSIFTLGEVRSKEGNEKNGYWNSTNREVSITIPVENDTTLKDGSFQVQVKFQENYQDIGNLISINQNSLGRDTLVIINGELFLNHQDFEENTNAVFRVKVWDKAGNNNYSNVSNDSLYIDTSKIIVTNLHVESNNPDSTLAKVGDSLFISFEVNEMIDSLRIQVFENECLYQNENNQWNSSYEFQDLDPDGDVDFNIYLEDVAGNINPVLIETQDSSSVYFDKIKPTLNSVQFYSSNIVDQGLAIISDTLFLDIMSNESIIDLGMFIGAGGVIYNSVDTILIQSDDNLSFKGSRVLDGNESEGFIPFKIGFSDLAGNLADTVEITTDNSSVLFDRTPPEAFLIDSIFAINGNQVEGFWNNTNEGVAIVIPIADDITLLEGGGIQIQCAFGDPEYLDLGSFHLIQDEDLGNSKILIVSKDDFEGLPGFEDNINAKFKAKMNDRAGNVTLSTDSTKQLHVDITRPELESIIIFSNNNLDSSWAKDSDSVYFNYASSESLSVSSIIINDQAYTSSNNDGFNWFFSLIVDDNTLEDTLKYNVIFNDLAGNLGDTLSFNDGQRIIRIDKTNPTIHIFYEGSEFSDLDYYNDSSAVSFYSVQSDSLSGIKEVYVTISDDIPTDQSLDWELFSGDTTLNTLTGLELINNQKYYGASYAIDYAGNKSDIIWGNGLLIDTQIPDTGKIEDGDWILEMDYTPDSTELKYRWEGFEDNVGILNYEIAIGTNDNQTNILDWFITDSLEGTTIRNLILERDTCYFTYMRAYDSALNVSEVTKTDGIYFDDSEPKVIKILPDINDSLGFLSIQKSDTIKIKFNRNIFFYELSIRSSANPNLIFDQFYSDSVLTILWEDTLASYDTLAVILDSALAYNTLFVSDTIYFYSQLWGDLNFDYDIDIKDILIFNERWPELDLGPIEGMPPHIYPKLDSQLNLIDMSSFAKMWHWRYFNLSFDSALYSNKNIDELLFNIKNDVIHLKIPDEVYMAELLIGNSNINVPNYKILNSSHSTFLFESFDSTKQIKQFSLANKDGLDTLLKIGFKAHDRDFIQNKIQYKFMNYKGDTLLYNNIQIHEKILPDQFRVYDNYPNPFNPITKIKYDIPITNNLSIKIFNILGEEIYSLNKSPTLAGRHEFAWNGLNNNGLKVSSGVYIVQFQYTENFDRQKILLLK